MSGRAATTSVIPGKLALSVGDPGTPPPPGWVRVPLLEIAELGTGHTPSRSRPDYWAGNIPWISLPDARDHHTRTIQNTTEAVSELGIENSAARILPTNTVGLSRTASVGYVFVMGRPMATSQDFVTWTCSDALDPRYLMYALLAEGDDIRRFGKGSTHTTIYFPEVKAFQLCVAPLAEQRRIVAKLDSLRARSARAREELDRIPKLIERYKQAILAKAFSGELTADWRRARSFPSGLGQDLANFRLDDQERGAWPTACLPAGWRWLHFDDFFEDWTDSTRKLAQAKYLAEGPFPVVDQGAQLIGGYTDDPLLLSRAKAPIILFGDHTRCVKFVDFPFVQGADGTKVLKPREGITHRFAYYALQAVALPDKGYSRHMKFVRASMFPSCVEEEQVEIVRRIEHAFTWLDKIAAEHARAAYLLPKLDQAILAKAFRGDLVPQDPKDEPASALLARIKAERGAARAKRVRGGKAHI